MEPQLAASFCQVHKAPQHGNRSRSWFNLVSLFGYLLVSIVNVKMNLSGPVRLLHSNLLSLEKKAWVIFLKSANPKLKLLCHSTGKLHNYGDVVCF